MNTLDKTDAQNLITLLNKTPIIGGEAEVVSLLKFKLSKMLEPENTMAEKPKTDKKGNK